METLHWRDAKLIKDFSLQLLFTSFLFVRVISLESGFKRFHKYSVTLINTNKSF